MNRSTAAPIPASRPRCPGLLVSVRSPREANAAVAGGADLIDIKEPARGPLGRPSPEVIAAVAEEVGAVRPLSVALGELVDSEAEPFGALADVSSFRYAKLGLAGAGDVVRWWRNWEQAWRMLPGPTERVGVIYADWQAAKAPPPDETIRVFSAEGCSAVLIDTFTKDGRSLLDHIESAELSGWTGHVRESGSTLVLAGSLSISSLGELRRYQPDYVAVRGAACRGGRGGRISRTRTRQLAVALQRAFT